MKEKCTKDELEIGEFLSALQLSIDIPISGWEYKGDRYIQLSFNKFPHRLWKLDYRFKAVLEYLEAIVVVSSNIQKLKAVSIPLSNIGPRNTNFLLLTRLDPSHVKHFLGHELYGCCAKEYLQFYESKAK